MYRLGWHELICCPPSASTGTWDATTGGYYSSICYLGMFIGAPLGRIADKIVKETMVICMAIWGSPASRWSYRPTSTICSRCASSSVWAWVLNSRWL